MLIRRPDPGEPREPHSKAEEIAELQVKSDSTLARANRLLSPGDERIRQAVTATSVGIRRNGRG